MRKEIKFTTKTSKPESLLVDVNDEGVAGGEERREVGGPSHSEALTRGQPGVSRPGGEEGWTGHVVRQLRPELSVVVAAPGEDLTLPSEDHQVTGPGTQ